MAKPTHIAFILDGNRRWAKRHLLSRNLGHKKGVEAIASTIKALRKEEIPFASFFCFSTQNWKRSREEVDGIFALAHEYFSSSEKFFLENDVSVEFFGDLTLLPKSLQPLLSSLEQKTANCRSLKVAFCLNYGGREDILQAVNSLLAAGEKNVTEKLISEHLHSKNFPDPDFVIRTSGEMRLSNFQLWQISYAELYFPKVLWPDFNEKYLKKSLKVFAKRKRRFGGN